MADRVSIFLESCFAFAIVAAAAELFAGEAPLPPLGSPAFQPTPDNPYGWRGDGNGRFPAAEPPLTWGRSSKSVRELTAQAKRPKAGDKGAPMPQGMIRDWLIVGPVPVPTGKTSNDEFDNGEDKLEPDDGDKLGNLAWKAIKLDTAWMNFWPIYKAITPDAKYVIAYAHAWIHSADGKPVFLNTMIG